MICPKCKTAPKKAIGTKEVKAKHGLCSVVTYEHPAEGMKLIMNYSHMEYWVCQSCGYDIEVRVVSDQSEKGASLICKNNESN